MIGHYLIILAFTFLPFKFHAEESSKFAEPKESYLSKIEELNDFKNLNYNDFISKWGQTNVTLHQNSTVSRWLYPKHRFTDSNNIIKYKPSIKFKEVIKFKDDTKNVIIEAEYNIDSFSKRLTPIKNKETRKRFVSLLGCSFVFGVGLREDQTVSFYLSSENDNISTYNFGSSATGTNSVLAQLENTNFKEQISEKTGDFVYVFMEQHIERSVPSWPNIEWSASSPYFEYDEKLKKYVITGSLEEKFPIKVKTLKFLGKNLISPFFNNRIFPKPSNDDILYTCHLVNQMKKHIEEKYPNSSFYLYNHPLSETPNTFINCLRSNQINFLDSANTKIEIKKMSPTQQRLPDGHPTELVNRLIASDIAMQLNPLK